MELALAQISGAVDIASTLKKTTSLVSYPLLAVSMIDDVEKKKSVRILSCRFNYFSLLSRACTRAPVLIFSLIPSAVTRWSYKKITY